MERTSWLRTFAAQLLLCFALYISFKLGQPQNSKLRAESERRSFDLYFISVKGGYRHFSQQAHLLKQMEEVAKIYKARFVINISELGEDDPLMHNATRQSSSLKVPWYTTRVSKGNGNGYFLKQVKITEARTLDIIGLDTGLLQVSMLTGSSNESENSPLHWLRRTLEASGSNWRIAVGYHPLVGCEESDNQRETAQVIEDLEYTFMKFEVNAYLSGQGCSNHVHQNGLAYIGNPGPMEKRPHLALLNERSIFKREFANAFLLHRVSSLEIVTYFITSNGEVVHRNVIQQRGKEVM